MTGLPPPATPITAQTYADKGLPFFDSYREKTSKVSGAFEGVRGVVEVEAEQATSGESESEEEADGLDKKGGIRYPEKSLNLPIVMLDVDDTVPPFRSVNDMSNDEW